MARDNIDGAIWSPPLDRGDTVLSVCHRSDFDLVTLIVKQASGVLLSSVWKKGPDAQSDRLVWIPADGDPAVHTTLKEANEYLESTVGSLGDHH
jgi:hypothetical protein